MKRLNSTKIILIGNSKFDKQESMNRYLAMLETALQTSNQNYEIVLPKNILKSLHLKPHAGFGKWKSYFEKYFLFIILILVKRLQCSISNSNYIFHITDHSNSVYIHFLPKSKTIITCHDMLAIKGALGHKDAYCETGFWGKKLQLFINYSLTKSKNLIFVSSKTKNDFNQINPNTSIVQSKVIYHSINQELKEIEKEKAKSYLKEQYNFNKNYILTIGSNLPRKNKEILFELAKLKKELTLVFIGPELNTKQKEIIVSYGIQKQIIVFSNISSLDLNYFISGSECLIFPSFSEGFGWPIIEAFKAGCPVIASNIAPFIEIGESSCLYFEPTNVHSLISKLNTLDKHRYELLADAKTTLRKFDNSIMSENYLNFYQSIK
jgi:glycosyltransferase involved in cell wall biosynthesis